MRPIAVQPCFVTGKGGVGKTLFSAGLAAAWAREFGSACLVEFGDGAPGQRALKGCHGVHHVVVDPEVAMQAMATHLLGSAWLARIVTGNFAMRKMLRAAAGLRELAQLFAVQSAVTHADRTGDGNIPVVVDMPASGHAVPWLRAPRQLSGLLRSGPLYEVSRTLRDELLSADRCSVVVVSLPEQLALQESMELVHRLRSEVELSPSHIVINHFPREVGADVLAAVNALWDPQDTTSALGTAANAFRAWLGYQHELREQSTHFLEHLIHGQGTDRAPQWITMDRQVGDPTTEQCAQWIRDRALIAGVAP